MIPQPKYDVVVYRIENRRVEFLAGQRLPLNSGSFYTAEKRLQTTLGQINDEFAAIIVPHETYVKGDTVKDGQLEEQKVNDLG
jgi:hypothetical protein